jgi:hypothetical protein
MFRRGFISISGVLLFSGCIADSGRDWQPDSVFMITNERDNEIEVSVRLKDGQSAFAVEGLVLEGGETREFEQSIPENQPLSVATKIINPTNETYEKSISEGAPKYTVQIQSDSIEASAVTK